MWVVVYVAHQKTVADHIKELLTQEGFLIELKPIYKNLDNDDNYFEILVPQSEAQEVQIILMENGY